MSEIVTSPSDLQVGDTVHFDPSDLIYFGKDYDTVIRVNPYLDSRTAVEFNNGFVVYEPTETVQVVEDDE